MAPEYPTEACLFGLEVAEKAIDLPELLVNLAKNADVINGMKKWWFNMGLIWDIMIYYGINMGYYGINMVINMDNMDI